MRAKDGKYCVADVTKSTDVRRYVTKAVEAVPRKIRVNSVHPSPLDNRKMHSLEEGFSPGQGAVVKEQLELIIPARAIYTAK